MFSRTDRYILLCVISRNGTLNWENVDVKNVKWLPDKAGAEQKRKECLPLSKAEETLL